MEPVELDMENLRARLDATEASETKDLAAQTDSERILQFSASLKDRIGGPSDRGGAGPKRDWSAALDLVNEAFEAIRMAEERTAAAEDYQRQLIQHHAEQIRALETRLSNSEKRAEAAEARAKETESWLVKYHDTIVDGFQRTFVSR